MLRSRFTSRVLVFSSTLIILLYFSFLHRKSETYNLPKGLTEAYSQHEKPGEAPVAPLQTEYIDSPTEAESYDSPKSQQSLPDWLVSWKRYKDPSLLATGLKLAAERRASRQPLDRSPLLGSATRSATDRRGQGTETESRYGSRFHTGHL